MAWEWSHSQEAYQSARDNLSLLSPERLAEIWSEWKALSSSEHSCGGFHSGRYEKALKQARKRIRRGYRDELESVVFDWASSSRQIGSNWYGRTCDNGGFNAWMCPFGCGCHTVSFGDEE